MDKDKRWWLWEFWNGETDVFASPTKIAKVRACTEVRLVPVEDDVIRGNLVLDDEGLVTLRVKPDSLEAAIAGTRRGERWENWRFSSKPYLRRDHKAGGDAWEMSNGVTILLDEGWRRVEEPLKCPACGYECTNTLEDTLGNIQIVCDRCGVRGPVAVRESEAREAFRRMGR